MSEAANVSSIEALQLFRNALIIYLEKARPALEDASDEVTRTREWVRMDRRVYWENKARQSSRALSDAQQALFSAELAKLRAPSYAEKAAVQKARREVEQAEEKLRILKASLQKFETEAQPKLNQLEQLRTLLRHELPKGVQHLGELIKRLETYAAATSSSGASSSPGPAAPPSL